MKNLRFKLLFEGDEEKLATTNFELQAATKTINFTTDKLVEADNLIDELGSEKYRELIGYFSYPGFLLYGVVSEQVIFFVLYREYQQRHQLYDRGFFDLKD